MAQKYNHGEYISLSNLDDEECPTTIKGHVTIEQAQAELDRVFGKNEYTVSEIKQIYAFWGFANTDFGDKTSCLFIRNEPGRGRFKVTECVLSSP